MPSHQHDFMFDVNFAFGSESVFTLTDHEELGPFPPIEGYFLTLSGPIFGLLDGQNMDLL